MKNYLLVIGIDVSKSKLDACFVLPSETGHSKHICVNNTRKGVQQLCKEINKPKVAIITEDGYTDTAYASVIGELLNFYKNASVSNISCYIKNKQKVNSGILPISPIDIIELNDYIPITELEEVLSKDMSLHSRRLMESLSELTEEERKERIDQYNEVVKRKIQKCKRSKGFIDLGYNLLLDSISVSMGLTGLGTALSFIKLGKKGIHKSIPLLRNIVRRLEEAMHQNTDEKNIHFLTKINRVAKLKRK